MLLEDNANMIVECTDDEAQPIEFKSTKFQYCFIPGSQESIDFHQSIEGSDADSIF